MTIIYWTVSWLIGLWLAATSQVPWSIWLTLCLLGILSAVSLRHRPVWQLLSICLIILCLGASRYNLAVRPQADSHVSNYNGSGEATIMGVVTSEPDVRANTTDFEVDAESLVMEDGSAQAVTGKVLVKAQRYPEIAYGARLQMTGQLKSPKNLSGFNYERYLAQRDIYSEMGQPEMAILETGLGNPLMRGLLAIKARAKETINRQLPEPEAALLNGILLGYDHGLPAELAEDFQTTGTAHIIVISGFNIAIIAGILLRGSRYFVSPRKAGLIAIIGIWLYAILVGADTAVVRAAIMASMFIVALLFLGRPTFLYASLFAAALFLTVVNPFMLWDAGFQLSFMAVLGLMLYVGPWSSRISAKLEPRVGEDRAQRITHMVADVSLTTLAAIMMTLPIMLLSFNTLSLVSPLANLLILPAQPGVMIVGGLATILGMISPILGQIPAWAAWLLLTYTINVVRFFAALPFSSIESSIPAFGVIVYYGLIAAMTWISGQDKETRLDLFGRSRRSQAVRAGIVVGIFALALVGLWLWNQPDGKLHVTFFDVGQGDAIFIESPSGRQVVVDGGRNPRLFLDKLGREMPFWDKDIDIVVATHPDEDHIMGLVDTFGHYDMDLLLVNGEEATESEGFTALLEAAREDQTFIRHALAGEVIELGDGVRLEILPVSGPELDLEDRNENSVSMRLVYGDFAVLLTGDAEEKAERMMMERGRPLHSTVFKAGHHGSRSSSSRLFLQAIQPEIIIISAGKENQYDHPHSEVLQRAEEIGAAVLRTDEMGSVEIISDGQQVWVETER